MHIKGLVHLQEHKIILYAYGIGYDFIQTWSVRNISQSNNVIYLIDVDDGGRRNIVDKLFWVLLWNVYQVYPEK